MKSDSLSDIVEKFKKARQRTKLRDHASSEIITSQNFPRTKRAGKHSDMVHLPKLDRSLAPVGGRREAQGEDKRSWINLNAKDTEVDSGLLKVM